MIKPRPIEVTAAEIGAITGMEFGQCEVTAWQQNLEIVAGECLSKIEDVDLKKAALKNLIAHFLLTQGKGQKTSESLGDASSSFKDTGTGSAATSYGSIARQIAPCLGVVMGDRPHTAGAMLIR